MKLTKKKIIIGVVIILFILAALVSPDKSDESETGPVSTPEPTATAEPEKTKQDAYNEFVNAFNEKSDTDFVFKYDFNPQDKESGHYRTEFRLGAYNDSYGVCCDFDDTTADIIIAKNYIGEFDKRIYTYGLTFDQLISIVEIASPIMDPELTSEELTEAIEEMKSKEFINGLYFGKMGLTFSGTEEKGYDLMLKYE